MLDLERRVESCEALVKKPCECFDKERTALKEERSSRKTLKGPLKGLFEHANDLIKSLRPPQPQPSASRTPVTRDNEPQRE